jgi:aldose 1-epimerase
MKKLIRNMLLASLALSVAGGAEDMAGTVEHREFGTTPQGQPIRQYILTNANGVQARIMTYGATWTHMLVPDRYGRLADVLLGFDSLEPYLGEHPYFGSTVGRVANRIAKGKFELDGKSYTLATNNGPNHLHGGLKGLDKVVWDAREVERRDGPAVEFTCTDHDGDNGYPGTVENQVVFTLTNGNELRIDYQAITDEPTPINLTNHAYFNLHGPGSGTVLDHVLTLHANNFTPVDDTLIPTGQIQPVAGTPMDFTRPKPIGADVNKVGANPTGYDHNYVLNPRSGDLAYAARVSDPDSGRGMEVWTDQPGIQFYSGNFLDGTLRGKGGIAYQKHHGFCLETQHFPDSINQPSFPNTVLRPGEHFRSTTVYRFVVDK